MQDEEEKVVVGHQDFLQHVLPIGRKAGCHISSISVTRIYIGIYEYSNIRYSTTNNQFSVYKYIRYLYSANLLRPNIVKLGPNLS